MRPGHERGYLLPDGGVCRSAPACRPLEARSATGGWLRVSYQTRSATISTPDRLGHGARFALAVLYISVNLPFAFKYPQRAGGYGLLAAVLYVAFAAALWLAGPRLARACARRDRSGWGFAAVTACVAITLALVMTRFDPEALRVTRYPAIREWLDHLLHGRFPYASAVLPSSFPVLFLIALPFHAIGEAGFLQIAAFVAFAWACHRAARSHPETAWFALGLLLAAPLFLYEIVTRSELFSNMTLVLLLLSWLEGTTRPAATPWRGIAAGLLLSTRGIVGLAYAVFLPWRFREERRSGIVMAAWCLATFVATLVPFILWDAQRFARFGPFAIQLSYIPKPLLAGVFAAAIAWGSLARSVLQVWLGIVWILFGVIAALFGWSVALQGWTYVLVQENFDISYFAFAHTFLIWVVARFSSRESGVASSS
jgi:hypothetical protein